VIVGASVPLAGRKHSRLAKRLVWYCAPLTRVLSPIARLPISTLRNRPCVIAVPPNLCAFFRCFGYVLRRVAPALQAVRGATSTNAVALRDSNPASGIGFAPACSREVRGSAGANVGSPTASLVIAWRMAAKDSSINSSSSYTGCCIRVIS
jgi:hypothetical protein